MSKEEKEEGQWHAHRCPLCGQQYQCQSSDCKTQYHFLSNIGCECC